MNKRIKKKKRKNNAILYSPPFGFYGLGPIDIQKANAIARKRYKLLARIKRNLQKHIAVSDINIAKHKNLEKGKIDNENF